MAVLTHRQCGILSGISGSALHVSGIILTALLLPLTTPVYRKSLRTTVSYTAIPQMPIEICSVSGDKAPAVRGLTVKRGVWPDPEAFRDIKSMHTARYTISAAS